MLADDAQLAPQWLRFPGLSPLAVAAAMLFTVLLGARTLASPDLGYHLSYGQRFLESGEIVDHSPEVYTLPDAPPLPETGPGCWYDDAGRYRFANANWGTQAVMAWVYGVGGVLGLCILQSLLVAGVALLLVALMRRLGVGWAWCAAAAILVACASYERLTLRPEVFAFVILLAQAAIVLPLGGNRLTPGWGAVAGLVGLQLVAVNVHSYWLLGLALVGAVWIESLLRRLLPGMLREPDPDAHGRRVRRLGVALAAMAAVAFANPWTWRLAVLPFETLRFLRVHGINAPARGEEVHPWAYIGEFYKPFAGENFAARRATVAFIAVLGAAGLGLLAALARMRLAWALVLLGFAPVSLSMRRNIAPGSMVLLPVALAATLTLWRGLAARRAQPPGPRALQTHRIARIAAVTAVVLAGGGLSASVLSQQFYTSEYSPVRFGCGLSRVAMPLGAAEWINRHRPVGRIWCDYDTSSNLHWFTRPHAELPILTNTWAYPPAVMRTVLASEQPQYFPSVADAYDVNVLVTRTDSGSGPLALAADRSAKWSLVHLGPQHAVFLRNAGPNAVLARRYAIRRGGLDAAGYIDRLRAADPAAPGGALYTGGFTLYQLMRSVAAVEVLEAAVGEDPRLYRAWVVLGICRTQLAAALYASGRSGAPAMRHAAREALERAMEIDPDAEPARAAMAYWRKAGW